MPAGDAAGQPDASPVVAEAVAIAASGKKPKRATRILQRAQRRQQQAQRRQQAAAARENAGGSPGLGALNRQLELLLEQLGAAHRVIGRVAAERDALRQQLADLQGIPVEDIVVPSIGASKEE